MDQLDDKLDEIQLLLSQLSDVRISSADGDSNNVDGMLDALIEAQSNNVDNNQDFVDTSTSYNDISTSDAVDTTISSPTESECTGEESADEMIQHIPDNGSPQNTNNDRYSSNNHYRNPNQPYINTTTSTSCQRTKEK